jgi:galactokinase
VPDLDALARVAQRAEHEFAGTRCGIMDQMIACHGRADQVLCLDTRTLESVHLPLPPSLRLVVCNTMVAHELASAEYNARRGDCELGVRALSSRFTEIHALRDATLDQLDAIGDDLTAQVRRRCRHVITENERVVRAAAALRRNDYAEFGALMAASHASLRDDYEVSCPELDRMAGIASDLDGVFGARMTGGGFGGSVIALIPEGAAPAVGQSVRDAFAAAALPAPAIQPATPSAGARREYPTVPLPPRPVRRGAPFRRVPAVARRARRGGWRGSCGWCRSRGNATRARRRRGRRPARTGCPGRPARRDRTGPGAGRRSP